MVLDMMGSKRHSRQAEELSQQIQTAVQIVSKPPAPSNGARFTVLGQASQADPLDDWRCSS